MKKMICTFLLVLSSGLSPAVAQSQSPSADAVDVLNVIADITKDSSMSASEKITATSQVLSSSYIGSQYAILKGRKAVEQLPMSIDVWNTILSSLTTQGMATHLEEYRKENSNIRQLRIGMIEGLGDCLTREEQEKIPTCASQSYWSYRYELSRNGKRVDLGSSFYSDVMRMNNAQLLLMRAPLCDLIQSGLPKEKVYELIRFPDLLKKVLPAFGMQSDIESRMSNVLESLNKCIPQVSLEFYRYSSRRMLIEHPKECRGNEMDYSCTWNN